MAEKFKFKIENVTYEWHNPIISGADVRTVGPGIPESMDLFLKEQGKPGRLIGNDDNVNLEDHGIEKFYSQEAHSGAGI